MAYRLPVSANPPKPSGQDVTPFNYAVVSWLTSVITEIYQFLSVKNPTQFPVFTVSTLPDATEWAGAMIAVSDEVGGYTMAFSDGTNWRRVQDRAVVA